LLTGADYAEQFSVLGTERIEPGSVVMIERTAPSVKAEMAMTKKLLASSREQVNFDLGSF
jgi:hypothetical protein